MVNKIFESRAFEGIGKLVDILLLGIYWLICSIPIITIGASTTALYYAVHKVIYQGRGYVTPEFFHSFKDNFKQATLSWLVFLVIGGICGADLYITKSMLLAGETIGNMWIIFVVISAVTTLWGIYLFTYMARFSNTFKQTFKNAGALMIVHLGTSLIILVITAFFAFFSYSLPVLGLFVPAFYMVSIHPLLEKVYRKYMSEEDLAREESYNE